MDVSYRMTVSCDSVSPMSVLSSARELYYRVRGGGGGGGGGMEMEVLVERVNA